jgi:hypothetical protein
MRRDITSTGETSLMDSPAWLLVGVIKTKHRSGLGWGEPGARRQTVQGKQTKKGLGGSWMIATDLLQFDQELRLSRFVWRHFIFLSQKNKSTEHWFSPSMFSQDSRLPMQSMPHSCIFKGG